MDTTAIIQFIGIVLFSANVPGDPGVHAIVPRIEHAQHQHISFGATQAQNINPAPGVEDHAAVIIYRTEDRLSRAGNWKKDGTLKNGWEFVELDGEQLQFLSNGVNDVPVIPADLPRAFVSANGCLKPPSLNNAFRGPLYKGAAAVVDIPYGTLDVCATNNRSVTERVDTNLLLKNEGVLVIAAKNWAEPHAKTIALDGDAVVYVANVPPYYLFTGVEQPNPGEPHWEAYNAMLESPCGGRPEGPMVKECAFLSRISESYRKARAYPPSDGIQLINSECSNSQWP